MGVKWCAYNIRKRLYVMRKRATVAMDTLPLKQQTDNGTKP